MRAYLVDAIISAVGLVAVGHGSWMFITERVPKGWPGVARAVRSLMGAAVLELFVGAGLLVYVAGEVLFSIPLEATAFVMMFFGVTLGAVKDRQAGRRMPAEVGQAPRVADDRP